MADTETVSSPADLSASFTPGADAGAGAGGTEAAASEQFNVDEPGSPDAPGGEEDINYDQLNDQGNPDAEAEPPVEVAEPAVEAPAQVAELPEGVRKGKDRNGKDGFWLNPQRYESFHGAHKLLRDTEAMMGEPVTPAALDVRQRAYVGQEKLYNNMLSGDPALQADVITHFFNEARRASEEGEVGGNPMVPFTQQFYQIVREADPDAYAALRSQAASDLVDEMYLEAAQKANRSLWLSAQHFDKILGRQYKSETEMANLATGDGDQLARLRAENDALRNERQGRVQQSQAAQFETWRGGLNQQIGRSLSDEVIFPALASVRDGYKNYPEKLKWISERLHSYAQDSFKDAGFRDRVRDLMIAAKRAPSEQKKNEFAQQIVNLHRNKARLAVDTVKASILGEAARDLKAQSDRTHQRRSAAQQERAPSGGGAAVRTSLAPVKGMDFENATPASLARSLDGLFPR